MFKTLSALLGTLALLVPVLCLVSPASGQAPDRPALHFRVSSPAERLEMIVNTSRILALDHKVPQLLVDNPQIVRASPLSPNEIQLSALRPGFTQLNVWDENDKVYSIDVIVSPDARELENVLMSEFPEATIRVRPLANSVIISGFVPSADMVGPIISIAEDFYPTVQNNLTVGGVQQVLLHVKVMEVSRTKLRAMGFDWASLHRNSFVAQSVSGLLTATVAEGGVSTVTGAQGDTVRFGIINDRSAFFGFMDALRQHNLSKVLAEPTLVAMSGRPARFHSGGEFGFLLPQAALLPPQVDFKPFGTQVDFVPIVLGNGSIRLEVRPVVSEIDFALGASGVPGFRTRSVDTAVEMKAGQTLALAGLIQTRVEAENRGIPWLADLPWVGAAFRRVEEQVNEVELLVIVTPELVAAVDPHEMPPCGPGQLTTSPDDVDLYWRGYMEVPRCCLEGNCPSCRQRRGGAPVGPAGTPAEEIPPGDTGPGDPDATDPGQRTGSQPGRPANGGGAAAATDPQIRPVRRPAGPAEVIRDDRRASSRPANSQLSPKLIGPSGYDVLK